MKSKKILTVKEWAIYMLKISNTHYIPEDPPPTFPCHVDIAKEILRLYKEIESYPYQLKNDADN